MPAPKKRCRECRLFLGAGKRCEISKGLDAKACDDFKPGRPFAPKFHGRKVKEIKLDPQEPGAWAFWISDYQVLMVAWELDHNQYGHFRCFMMTLNDDGVETKQFSANVPAPAFAGEVVVKGARENDLWSSFGYEDDDEFDLEGNLINKPREVKLYPARED